MGLVKELRGFVVRVRDLEKALHLYRDGLGLEVSHAASASVVQLRIPGSAWIELALSDQLPKVETPTDRRQSPESIVFNVEDVEAAMQRLVDHGATIVNQPFQIPGVRIAYLADADGHVLGLSQVL